jgi:lipopolysaccharide export system protein LptA
MKIRKIITVIMLVFIPLIVFSQTKSPVKVEADHLRYSGDSKISMFEGNVVAYYEDTTIYSDKMDVYLSNERKADKIVSLGNVKILKDNVTALSDYAEMDINSDIITLKGDVRVWQEQNYMEGEEISIYTKEDRVVVNKGKSSRVKIIFYPDGDNSTDNKTKKDNTTDNKTDLNESDEIMDSDNSSSEGVKGKGY